MIQLSNNFSNVEEQPFEPFTPPPSGGYVFEVVNVIEKASNAGNQMIQFDLDISEGTYKGAFANYPKSFYQLTNDEGRLKAVLKAFKDSNGGNIAGLVTSTFQLDVSKLKGLKIAGCLRDEEYISSQGELKTSPKVAYLTSLQRLQEGHVKPMPMIKHKPTTTQQQQPNQQAKPTAPSTGQQATNDPFSTVDPDDLPF